jgi:hypothetical protein
LIEITLSNEGRHNKAMKVTRLVIILSLITLMAAASAVLAAPRLVLPETTFNFGYVPQNAKISHDFWLYSKGEDSLIVLKVVPG